MTRGATCSAAGCDRPAHARGLCIPHYERVLYGRGLQEEYPIGALPRPGQNPAWDCQCGPTAEPDQIGECRRCFRLNLAASPFGPKTPAVDPLTHRCTKCHKHPFECTCDGQRCEATHGADRCEKRPHARGVHSAKHGAHTWMELASVDA